MLMTLVSLSAFAQYPTTKKIKGEQVVIMTVKQAEAINDKFQMLEDSISRLNSTLNGCTTSLYFTQDKLEAASNSLTNANDSIVKLNGLYVKEVKRQDKLEWIDKQTKIRVAMGLGATVLTWLILAITAIQN